jgi:hypothetical protein
MPSRTEATVYFPQDLEVDRLLLWLEETNAARPAEDRLTLFEVLLTALARTLRLRPEANRFVAGRRLYQHDTITVSFTVKADLSDGAPESQARLRFTGHERVDDVHAQVSAALRRERAGVPGADDELIDFFASWPGPALRVVGRLVRVLDDRAVLPARLVDAVPLFTSVFLVNTGSLGIGAPFHHLYEVGSASVFVAIGRAMAEPVVDEQGQVVARTRLRVVFTLDERATDGYYFARTAEVFRRLVQEPGLLEDAALSADDIVPQWPLRR